MRDSEQSSRQHDLPGEGYKKPGCCEERDTQAQGLSSSPLHPSLLSDASVMDLNNLSANLTNITNTFAEKPSIATLATILLSITGLQDWAKLFLIGGVFETCRRLAFQAWYDITDSFWITVDFEEGDDSYGKSSVQSPDPTARSLLRAQHRAC